MGVLFLLNILGSPFLSKSACWNMLPIDTLRIAHLRWWRIVRDLGWTAPAWNKLDVLVVLLPISDMDENEALHRFMEVEYMRWWVAQAPLRGHLASEQYEELCNMFKPRMQIRLPLGLFGTEQMYPAIFHVGGIPDRVVGDELPRVVEFDLICIFLGTSYRHSDEQECDHAPKHRLCIMARTVLELRKREIRV